MQLSFTDRAREMVVSFMGEEESPSQALRISVVGSPFSPQYELTLVDRESRGADDVEVDAGPFAVLVDSASARRLEGATVDFVERLNESGFEVRPAADTLQALRSEAPEGALADRVRSVLESQINPAVASHGGGIELVAVEGSEIYIEMTGGCQGCAMSRMTLRQGVERMVRQAVPEVTAIHDVTDHAGGANPFFS